MKSCDGGLMKKYFFKSDRPNIGIGNWRLLGLYAMALLEGENPSKTDLTKALGRGNSAATDMRKNVEAYYGVSIVEEGSEQNPNPSMDWTVPSVLSDHALHFSLMDFMVCEVLKRPEHFPDELVLKICDYARKATELAVDLASEIDAALAIEPPHRDYDSNYVIDKDGNRVKVEKPGPLQGTGPFRVLPGPKGAKRERFPSLTASAERHRKKRSDLGSA